MKKQRFNYNAKDGANIFFWLLLANLVLSFFFVALLSQLATAQNMTIEQYMETETYVYINMAFSQLILIGTLITYNLICKVKTIPATRIKTKPNWTVVLMCVLIAWICLFGSNYFVGLFDFVVLKISGLEATQLEVGSSIWTFLLCTVFVSLLPAIFEELIFRGVMFNGFKAKYSTKHAVLLSALFFALMHMSISQFIYQFGLGIVFALICHYTGSTLYSIITHFVNNFTVILISFIDDGLFVNTAWGFWEVFGAFALLLAGIALVIVVLKVLQKYCQKHKTAAYHVVEKPEIEEQIKQSEGLTAYEIKQISTPRFTDKALLTISLVFGIVMWVLTVLS